MAQKGQTQTNFRKHKSVSKNTNQFKKHKLISKNANKFSISETQTKTNIQETGLGRSLPRSRSILLVCADHAEAMFCSNCGTHLKEEFRFCTNCGQERPEQGPQQGTPVAATVQKRAAPTLDEYLGKKTFERSTPRGYSYI